MKYIAFISTTLAVFMAAGCCNVSDSVSDKVSGVGNTILDTLRLVDYKPVSIVKGTDVSSAKFRVIDMHSHNYRETVDEIKEWVRVMDENNVEKTIVLTKAVGKEFDAIYDLYKGVAPERFDIWCGFDFSSLGTSDFPAKAIAELERCNRKGAKGVGELHDKGMGVNDGWHFDNDVMIPLFEKCAELKMPVNIHFADPIWMYQEMDEHNDGYPNAFEWKIDMSQKGIYGFEELMDSMEKMCYKNPKTQFIACHLINLSPYYDRLASILDRHPNLMIDISARHNETAITPRATARFYEKYSDRILFGTDNTPTDDMYNLQWRILETDDEHFYADDSYHWALYGLDLSDRALKKIYRENARELLEKCQF